MRVEVDYEVATQMVNVYVLQDVMGGGGRVWTPTDAFPGEWYEVPEGGAAPVSLRIPRPVWEAMSAAAGDVPMPSAALANHLKDACEVRDRLLVMAERSTLRPAPSDG